MLNDEIIKKALEQISKRRVNYEYFFDHLNSPEWIEPLYKRGMFQKPPPPKKEGEYISFPIWPESRYLTRMAALSPKIIVPILLEMPSTENTRIHEDIIEAAAAACNDEPEITSKLVDKEIGWIKSQSHLPLMRPEKLIYLINRLGRVNKIDLALDLASVTLGILPEAQEVEDSETETRTPLLEPRSRFRRWEYDHILTKLQPILLEYAGVRALKLFCGLLEDAIRSIQSTTSADEKISDDYSFIWRPAVEDHSQSHSNDIKNDLVTVIRDTAETLMESDGLDVLSIVEGYPFKIFQRIGLHLRRNWIDVDLEGTSAMLTNHSILCDIHLHHELFQLLQSNYYRLLPPAQKAYLDYVENGEDQDKWVGAYEERTRQRPTQDDLHKHTRYWQYTTLFPIQEFLDAKWQETFSGLKHEFGQLDHPDFHFYTTGVLVGPVSPKSSEELRSLSIEEIISFIKSWVPTDEFMGHSHEGLARELTRLVNSSPDRFAREAERFENVNPVYIGALLSGLREGALSKTAFTWQPVLKLCHWIVNQTTEIIGQDDQSGVDKSNWTWPLRDIADLLSAGFNSETAQIPFNLRAQVWEVLKPITDDPDPTPELEKRDGGSNMDPAALSLNTTRGKAMHAVMKYALWVCRNIIEASEGTVSTNIGFKEIPEVCEVFESHLDPKYDPALSIRAVYGDYIPQFVYIDPEWTIKNMPKIFPLDEAHRDYYKAAWETYISYCHPYDDVFDVLNNEYGLAIQRLSETSVESPGLIRPAECLAEHLMVFYWRGKLDLKSNGGLVEQFFSQASDSLRGHAIDIIGRILADTEDTVPEETLNRLKALWSWRRDAVKITALTSLSTAELGGFGWWFVSEKFDNDWAITQLKEALLLGAKVEPEPRVVERLATLSASIPYIVIECLRLIVESDREGWNIYSWREQAKQVISTALRSTDINAKKTATSLVNYLGAKRFLDFGNLLPSSS